MHSWLEKITITLFLLLGVNAFIIGQAHSSEVYEAKKECPIKGQVYLRLNGTLKNGQLYGWIDNDNIFWSVFSGRVTGFVGNTSVSLTMKEIDRGEYSLIGWAGLQRINWRSLNKAFNETVICY